MNDHSAEIATCKVCGKTCQKPGDNYCRQCGAKIEKSPPK